MYKILLFLSVLVIGGYATYTDICFGVVKNKLIFLGFAVILVLYLGFVGFLKIDSGLLIFNFCASLIAAYLIWHFGYWSAGDAKLFILFSFSIVSPRVGSNLIFKFLPFLNLLINVFLLVIIFLFFEMIAKGLRITFQSKNKKQEIIVLLAQFYNYIKNEKIRLLIKLWVFLLVYFCIKIIFWELAKLRLSILNLLCVLSAIFIYQLFMSFLNRNKKLLFVLSIILSFYILLNLFNGNQIFMSELISSIRFFFFFSVPLLFLYKGFNAYISKNEYKDIDILELRPKMVLFKDANTFLNIKELGKLYSDGITQEQVRKIRDSFVNEDNRKIKICRTFPLAPFIFLGGILTLLFEFPILKNLNF